MSAYCICALGMPIFFAGMKCHGEDDKSINCAAEIFKVKYQWSIKARFLSVTTCCLKQTMPFFKDASVYFCTLFDQLIEQYVFNPNLPKELHLYLLSAHLYVVFTVSFRYTTKYLITQQCLSHFLHIL